MGHAEQVVQSASATALAVLVEEAAGEIGDDGAAGLAEFADPPGLGVGEGVAGRQDQDLVFGRDPAADQLVVGEEVVLDPRVGQQVFPGLADVVRCPEPVVVAAVDPGLAVGLDIQAPGDLDRRMRIIDRHAVVDPSGTGQLRSLNAPQFVQRGLVPLEPGAGLGPVEPAFDPADHPPVAVGEVVPALPDVRLDTEPVVVEVGGHLGPGVARIERAEDLLRGAEIVGLDELDRLGELGVVITAPDVGRLTADEAAGRLRIDACWHARPARGSGSPRPSLDT